MRALYFKRHRLPAEVIRYTVWLHFRFTLSFRDVEELLAQRDRGQLRDDPLLDDQVRPADRQELETPATGALAVLAVGRNGLFGRRMHLWRAVYDEGEVLDLVMQRRRDTNAALTLLKRL